MLLCGHICARWKSEDNFECQSLASNIFEKLSILFFILFGLGLACVCFVGLFACLLLLY